MNYYQILGVRATATTEEIEAAYRATSDTPDIERRLEASMAHSILTDEAKRDEFDQMLLRELQRREIERTKPIPTIDRSLETAQLTYIHQHYHHRTDTVQGDTSLLKVGLIWFIMALATTVVFFFMALVR